MVIACCEYEHILLASKEMALTTGKSTLLRKKCIFEAGTQPAFSFGKSHKWNQNSCGGNMKLCVRRLFFLIPHLILSTFHAGIRKIFLRLVLVNSPHLSPPPSSVPFSTPLLKISFSNIFVQKAMDLREMVIRPPLRCTMRAALHILNLALIWGCVEDQGFTQKGWAGGQVADLGSSNPSRAPLMHPCLLQPFLPSHSNGSLAMK